MHGAKKTTCADGEKTHYFDRNIWDMSIDITYFVLDILQVGISRSSFGLNKKIPSKVFLLDYHDVCLHNIFVISNYKVVYVSFNIGPGNQNLQPKIVNTFVSQS